jgi:glycosyltransferase involved in cell wall biosynthesis
MTRKVALVTETWRPEINGVAMTLSRLADGLNERFWRVMLVRPRQPVETPDKHEHLIVPGLPIPGYSGLRFGLPAVRTLTRTWQDKRPDIVHIATQGPLGWAALKAAHQLDLPVTTSFHTNFHQYCRHYRLGFARGVVQRYLRQFHNQARCTMTPNETLSNTMREEGYRNVVTVGRGVDGELFSPLRRDSALRAQWNIEDGDIAVIHVGRMAAEKNLRGVAEAFRLVQLVQPRARMIWVGDGPLLENMRKRYPAHVFVGAQVGEELARHYASADLFLFASLTETFGNVVLEAMSSGLAVLAYRYAAAASYIRHEQNGVLADFADEAGFNRLAATLAAQPLYLRQLGAEARASLQQAPWEAVCDQFEALLRGAVEGQA